MTRIKNTGILYTSGEKVRKFQIAGVLQGTGGYWDNVLKQVNKQTGYDPNNTFGKVMSTPGAKTMTATNTAKPATDFLTKPDSLATSIGKMTTGTAGSDYAKGVAADVKATNAAGGTTKPGVGAEIISQGANAAGTALQSIDDGKETKYSTGEGIGDVTGDMLKGAATGTTTGAALGTAGILSTMGTFTALGSTVPVLGTVAGAVIGAVVGGIKAKKAKKKAKKAKAKVALTTTNQDVDRQKQALREQDNLIATAPLSTKSYGTGSMGYGYRRAGGTFARITIPESDKESELKKSRPLLIAR